MSKHGFVGMTMSALALASSSFAGGRVHAERLHLATSPGAFLHVQYTSKAEFVEGLREHPRALNALARHFHVSSSSMLTYVSSNLHLGKLTVNSHLTVWGLSRSGHIFATRHWFKAGMPVWETSSGVPVLRWLCSNPLVTQLPSVAPAVIPAPPAPPAPPVQPAPPAPPEPPAPPTPPPAPEPPAPPTPPAPPAPPVAPPPPPPVQPTPEPVKPVPVYRATYDEPFRIWVGLTDWKLYQRDKLDTYFTLGASLDLLRLGNHVEAGIYFDSAGWMDKHPDYEYYGGGLDVRGYLDPIWSRSLNPYVGVGYGVYHNQIEGRYRDSGTTLAPRFTLGVEFSRRAFLEASYTAFGDHFGRDLGRPGVEVGIRF